VKRKQSRKPTLPFDRTRPQHEAEIRLLIPKARGKPDKGWTEHVGVLVSLLTEQSVADNRFVLRRFGDDPADWCIMHYEFLCEWDADEKAMKALKVATQRDRKAFRVPTFIQSEEWPMCCNRSMHFVGQIDDNDVCASPPPNFKYWWHDAASFYVFTCDQCLECKAIGQQF
jgi:hypothetical protein